MLSDLNPEISIQIVKITQWYNIWWISSQGNILYAFVFTPDLRICFSHHNSLLKEGSLKIEFTLNAEISNYLNKLLLNIQNKNLTHIFLKNLTLNYVKNDKIIDRTKLY